MKKGKAAGIDSITIELLRAGGDVTKEVLYELFTKIWDKEEIPEDWSKGLIVKLPKRGNLTDCDNWRVITLIPVIMKIFGSAIINRIRVGVDNKLRNEQAGYRQGRNTTEQIFVLRNIIEQVIEWNSNLYICLVDFEKAFDSVHRETLWKLLKIYGIPDKLVNMIKAMYRNSKCAVIDGIETSQWFDVKSGVKQECVMSGLLFLKVMDWIMTKTVENDNNGIRWNFTTVLEDIDFADDLVLLSSTKTHIQKKVDRLNKHSEAIGMKTSIKKTKLMRYNAKDQTPVSIDGKDVEDVDSFTYLGAIVNKTGGAEQDITARVGKARPSFNKLTKVGKSSQYSMRTKTRIFNSNVLTVLLYGSETWHMTKRDEDKLDSFQHKCLRKILKIYWPMKATNEEVRKRTGSERLSTQIRTRRWTWIGHVLRMKPDSLPRTALNWAPEGKRKGGRPRETWRRTVEKERSKMGFRTWTEAARTAIDRKRWKDTVKSPILQAE